MTSTNVTFLVVGGLLLLPGLIDAAAALIYVKGMPREKFWGLSSKCFNSLAALFSIMYFLVTEQPDVKLAVLPFILASVALASSRPAAKTWIHIPVILSSGAATVFLALFMARMGG